MLEDFQSYIEKEDLFTPDDKLILAVSGGVDSMVMLDLFQHISNDFVVAHCNFQLRGAESDSEEVFLQDYCGEHGVELYVKHFDTNEYAAIEGISIEMAARELRYNWFYELLEELSFSYLATAHHQDDLIETMLINLSRGTGIRGLSGIRPKKGSVIRPMLFTSRDDILNYAVQNKIEYKNDSSNDELIYQRNIIRHTIIPQFEEINPAFRRNVARSASILSQTEAIYSEKVNEIREKTVEKQGDTVKIYIDKLREYKELEHILFELLHPFGFNASQVKEIYEAFETEAGKSFFSKEYRLIKDRNQLIINKISPLEEIARHYIEKDCLEISEPIHLEFEVISKSPDYQLSRNPEVADLDYDMLEFPLIIKKWEQGEYFKPLGMSGFKKLSDYFIDEKFSIPEKENTWILCSGQKVVWIIGKRIDDRFKITNSTKAILRVKFLKSHE